MPCLFKHRDDSLDNTSIVKPDKRVKARVVVNRPFISADIAKLFAIDLAF